MSYHLRCLPLLALMAAGFWSSTVWAQDDGQADFDKATEKKLSADSFDDLAEVVELCESALKKGLDADNTEFAKSLITSTLMQRASVIARGIVDRAPPGWQQMRRMALNDIGKVLQYNPDLPEAYLLSGRLQALRGGDRVSALKAAERAFELAKDEPDVQVAALVLQGNLTEDQKKKLELYDQALEIAPNNDEALRYRGLFYLLTNKPDKAVGDLQAAAHADPENADVQEALGLTLMLLKKNKEAIEAFGDAIKLVPDSPIPYLHRARAYTAEKDYPQALEDLKQALERDPDNLLALLLRARIHQRTGDVEAARADVEAALKDRPDLVPALELRAALSAGEGDYSQAIEDMQELEKIAPQNKVLLTQLGWLYAVNKQPRKAIAKFDAALAIDANHFEALRGRGDAKLNIGKHAEAVVDYEAAMKVNPKDSGVLNNFAWVLATSPDDSVRDAKRSVELGTKAAEETEFKQAHILSTLAAGYAESGDFEKAVEWSKKAVDLGGEDSENSDQLKKELTSYENKEPWRERIATEEAGSDDPKPGSHDKETETSKQTTTPDDKTSAQKE